jgi:hypothetical protein
LVYVWHGLSGSSLIEECESAQFRHRDARCGKCHLLAFEVSASHPLREGKSGETRLQSISAAVPLLRNSRWCSVPDLLRHWRETIAQEAFLPCQPLTPSQDGDISAALHNSFTCFLGYPPTTSPKRIFVAGSLCIVLPLCLRTKLRLRQPLTIPARRSRNDSGEVWLLWLILMLSTTLYGDQGLNGGWMRAYLSENK